MEDSELNIVQPTIRAGDELPGISNSKLLLSGNNSVRLDSWIGVQNHDSTTSAVVATKTGYLQM